MNEQRLTKNDTNGKLAGVCAGLADYFGVDVTLVRLLFVVATFLGGPGILVYIVLALVLPEDPYRPTFEYGTKAKRDFS